jgi:hypothetical protein
MRRQWIAAGFKAQVWIRSDGQWQHLLERKTDWGWTGVSGAVGQAGVVMATLLEDDRWPEAESLLAQIGDWWINLPANIAAHD